MLVPIKKPAIEKKTPSVMKAVAPSPLVAKAVIEKPSAADADEPLAIGDVVAFTFEWNPAPTKRHNWVSIAYKRAFKYYTDTGLSKADAQKGGTQKPWTGW